MTATLNLQTGEIKMIVQDKEKKEVGKWWVWILALIVLTVIVLGVLSVTGRTFTTAVERELFEQSYQRSAAQEAYLKTLNAELTAVETRLRRGSLTDVQRSDLEAQAAGLRVQINQIGD